MEQKKQFGGRCTEKREERYEEQKRQPPREKERIHVEQTRWKERK